MTREEYIKLFHKEQLNLVAFKRLLDCDEEVLRLVISAIETEREAVANWLMRKGFATGHGDNIVDMLDELEWQVAEREREACAKICDEFPDVGYIDKKLTSDYHAHLIRQRGQA